MACIERTNLCNVKTRNFAIVKKNNYATVVVDIDQGHKWHLLVVPDAHSENISQVDEETWKEGLGPLIAWTICQLRKDLEIVGFHINTNAGRAAGQTVFHTHIHIIPTYGNGEGFSSNFNVSREEKHTTFDGGEWDTEKNILESWKEIFTPFKNHLKICENSGILTKESRGELVPFHLFARIGKVDRNDHKKAIFHFLPNPGNKKEFKWEENLKHRWTGDIGERNAIRDKILALPQNNPPPPPGPMPSPPSISKNQLQVEIANCDDWAKWEGNYQKIFPFSPEEQKELEKDLLNSLIKIIGFCTDLNNLTNLEANYNKHRFYTENTDEIRTQVDQFCSNHRREIEKKNTSQSSQNTHPLTDSWQIILVIFFGTIILVVFIRWQKKRKLKK